MGKDVWIINGLKIHEECYSSGGGCAGKGGVVNVASTATVNAFNGNECTLDENDSEYYEQPLEIYIQNGNPLDVYIMNVSTTSGENYANKRYERICNSLGIEFIPNWNLIITDNETTIQNTFKEFCITKEMRTIPYNATKYGQGIGSGAGYIEISNGIYKIDGVEQMEE